MIPASLKRELRTHASVSKAKLLQGFFKTGPGEYGAGDIFIGVTVLNTRKVAKKYSHLLLSDVLSLLRSKIHEERLLALLIMVEQFQRDKEKRSKIYREYLNNLNNVNNWDLVDLSSHKIVGEYLLDKPRDILCKLSRSKNVWARRVAIIATFSFIKNNQFDDSLSLAKILLHDKHDLIQKAVGWVLREVGKKNYALEKTFLDKYYKDMPRTMLRYAIERFSEPERQKYLKGIV